MEEEIEEKIEEVEEKVSTMQNQTTQYRKTNHWPTACNPYKYDCSNEVLHHKFSEDRMCTMCRRVIRKLTLFILKKLMRVLNILFHFLI